MSFSSEVRNEICAAVSPARHCLLAETAAMLNASASLSTQCITFHTENVIVAQRYRLLIKQLFKLEGDYETQGHSHTVTLTNPTQNKRILKATGFDITENNPPKDINPSIVMGHCCQRAYIRGSFIACGTLCDPNKTYHLEFALSPPNNRLAQRLMEILNFFGLHPKIFDRRSQTLVYLKESDEIADVLNIMEAHKSLMQLENLRILKEIGNSINRRVNFETANICKTASAAASQKQDIQYIIERVGLGYLSEGLEEVARLRLSNEEASLKEIGAMLQKPVSKSGVNHRLRKISEIAEGLRREAPKESNKN